MEVTEVATDTEGWGVIRPGDRKAHYYRDMTALCRRVGFYGGPLEPDTSTSRDDCAACRRELTLNKSKKSGGEAGGTDGGAVK
jgi:hypothetical protein